MVAIISGVSVLLTVFYVVLIATYRKGWKAISQSITKKIEKPLIVSVIIPARNEEKNITQLLQCLQNQDYLKSHFEIIVADDHSDDTTVQTALEFGLDNLRVIELAKIPGKRYKKAAITEAVKQAKGEIIITTDADCTMGNQWLSSIVSFFNQNNAALVSGPVVFSWDEKKQTVVTNFFLKIQQLEFAGLVGIGGAALQLKFPNMCNGANLAYRKEVFDEVGGYLGNDNLLSGDDEFLMHKVFSRYPQQVHFLKNQQAVVKTPPSYTWGQFLGQRMRWVSKSTKYSDKRITAVLMMAYLFNLSILINYIAAFFNPVFWWVFMGQILAKAGIEYLFYELVLNFFRLKPLQKQLLPAQPFHIAYVLMIGILGNFGSYNWKGRKQ
jgi:cellulose synthase/poly-beta-1,6-N-acetylglucosamine synthase-like glycosyltransferase